MKYFSFLIALGIAAQSFAQDNPVISNNTHTESVVYASVSKGARAAAFVDNDFNAYTKTKTFSKSYTVGSTKQLSLINKYGPIEIKIWNRNEVKADVVMKATSDNEKDAIALINGVELSESQSSEAISIKTILQDIKGKYGTSIRNGKIMWKREVNISYIVYMPANMALSANLQYGNLTMDDFNGPTNLKVQYGNINAGNLTNANNQLSVQYGSTNVKDLNRATINQQYGKGVNVGNTNELNLTVQYAAANVASVRNKAVVKVQYGGGLTIGSVGSLSLNAQYSPVKISSIKGDATINQQYNSLSLGTISNVNLTTQYTSVSISELSGDAKIKASYNSLSINNVRSSVRSLDLNTSYVNVTLAFDEAFRGSANLTGRYTGYKGMQSIRKTREDGATKYYAGTIGGGGNSSVALNAQYGNLTIK